jgi:hypothetical protein
MEVTRCASNHPDSISVRNPSQRHIVSPISTAFQAGAESYNFEWHIRTNRFEVDEMLALNSIVAVYLTQTQAEAGVFDLQHAGFDLKKLSVLGREHEAHDQTVGYYNTGGRMKYLGARGAFWNSVWKLLSGAGYFVVPGIGRVLIAGPLTVWIVVAQRDLAVESLSAVGAGLYEVNIPRASILRYESDVRMHKLLLIASGSAPDVLRARDVLRSSRPEEVNIHFVEEIVQRAA